MSDEKKVNKSILMIAYTNYKTDPRVIREAEAALGDGFKVDFITLRRADESPLEFVRGVRVIRLNQTRYRGGRASSYILSYLEFFVRCIVKTAILHLEHRYKVIHVNNIPDFFVFCALLPKMLGAKVILDIHDPMPNTFASKFKGGDRGLLFTLLLWQERMSASFSDCVITVHEPVKEFILVNQHHMASEAVEVIANFADDNLFRLRARVKHDGHLRMVFHGTILERYGLRNAMLAIASMNHKDRISVKIIGEGDFSDELKSLIGLLELDRVVQFDNCMYPLHEIPHILAEFNLGLVPLEISSITDFALPLKLLEYTALGMPSVTIRNKAIGYYFSEEDCLFYDPGDPESLRVILDRLVECPEILSRYQHRAEIIREKFLWSGEREKYIALLNRLSDSY